MTKSRGVQDFHLTVLGANSALPMQGRFSSSFVLQHNHVSVLIDCGEGSQIKMSQFGIKRSRITHVFISHLHGDHIFGLPGFLTSLILNDRKEDLTIVGPLGIQKFITGLPYVLGPHVPFDINFIELIEGNSPTIIISSGLKATPFALHHRIPTFGYRFDEVISERNIDSIAIQKYNLTIEDIRNVKAGRTVVRDGVIIPLSDLTLPPKVPRSFAYCSDTAYAPEIVPHILKVNLLYHEATYKRASQDKAVLYQHSTTVEAAKIATTAQVGKLLIGHYSSRYGELESYRQEAAEIFENVEVAEEGLQFAV